MHIVSRSLPASTVGIQRANPTYVRILVSIEDPATMQVTKLHIPVETVQVKYRCKYLACLRFTW